MGNTQSNEKKPNYKIYKIVSSWGKFIDKDHIRYYLNDYVTYKNGKYDHIDIEKNWVDYISSGESKGYRKGSYLKIDLNKTICEHSEHTFEKMIGPVSLVDEEHVIEKRDSNGNFIKYIDAAGDLLGEITQARERYQASVMDARGSNYANFRQTSYDMPPKW